MSYTMSKSRYFLDTNVLVYALDGQDAEKQKKARELLREGARAGNAVISTQVLQEFYVVATRKLGVDSLLAKNLVDSFGRLETVSVDLELVKEGIECAILSQLSLWDGLIVAAANTAKCDRVMTEDLSHGQVIRGVRIENPFRST